MEPLESGNPGMRENIFSRQINLWIRGNSDNRGIGACPSCFPHAPIPEVPLYTNILPNVFVHSLLEIDITYSLVNQSVLDRRNRLDSYDDLKFVR